ncbi:MAG TPA: MBL fold metallo-hydrolase [Gemmatimonadota bacterium]|nr:MBL fold metallo-hydrolase [Gemmatimonadota bacterium]
MNPEDWPRLAWPPLRWGERTVTVLSDGVLRLDGGAMFGVVPRVLWEKKLPADDRNRVRLGMNCLLIDGPEGRTIVEVGSGGKEDAKFAAMYGLERDGGLPARLSEAGAPPETIDRVVLSHLHFDHAGGATRWDDEGGSIVPTFPRATYHIHAGEYEEAIGSHARNQASYIRRDFVPLVEAGQVEWMADGGTIAGAMTVLATPGHTAHHCSIAVDDGEGRWLVFLGDLVPTTHHLTDPWIMAYDLYPVTTLETKQRVLPRAREEGWLCAFVHDAEHPLAYLRANDRGRLQRDPERDPWSG